MTATTTAPRPTPARTGATPTRTASTSTARTTPGNGRRNTTPPTETTETTETAGVGVGPAAGSEQRVHAALSAGGDLTVGALAEATGLGRSTVSKALTLLEAAGRAVRTTIGSSGRARQPDRWNPTTPTTTTTANAAVPPSPADTPQAQTLQAQTPPVPTPQAAPETPVGSGPGNGAAAGAGPRPTPARKGRTRRPSTQDTLTTSSPLDGPTSPPLAPSGPVGPEEGAEERMNPKSGTARLAPGALTQLVADHFGRHPGVPLTSGEVGRALGRSGGAVRNAADKLVGDGALRLLDGAPRRYTTTD